MQTTDAEYLRLIVDPIRVCRKYRPKLGRGGKTGYSLTDFKKIYGSDRFYSWIGLDDPLMYATHKAAGGMTSIYRQVGIGCEALFRRVLQDTLELPEEDVKWSYTVQRAGGKTRKLSLDARIPLQKVQDKDARRRIRQWMDDNAKQIDIDRRVAQSLRGVVFEIRQGYKSKDSKRQNADIANAATAYTKGYMPCVGVLSEQIDEDIALRYRAERWVLLTGSGTDDEHTSIYAFVYKIVGYDLAGFFERNHKPIRREVHQVLRRLLEPGSEER